MQSFTMLKSKFNAAIASTLDLIVLDNADFTQADIHVKNRYSHSADIY
jgi:hypothetical protein